MIQCKDCRFYQKISEFVGHCPKLGVVQLEGDVAALDFDGSGGVPVMNDFTAVMVWSKFGCRLGEQVLRCPQCGDDRTGKGSLIMWPDAYCDERCYELYKEAQNSGEASHHE